MNRLACLILSICSIHIVKGISSSIPNQLIKCYRSDYTTSHVKPPLSIRLLIELTRKIEWLEKDALNLRLFTTSLLHGIRFDGIAVTPGIPETPTLTPYSATGKQFYKYKLLVDYLTSGKPQLVPHDSLSTNELCLLHQIISNTVHVWERGNEGRTCPEYVSKPQQRGVDLSPCPIERGVVDTIWGTISPGHIIAGIASALQETTLSVQQLSGIIQKEFNITTGDSTDIGDISNIGVATIVGDLAEVAIQQAFNKPTIGTPGHWNSTTLPREFFLESQTFDMTRAELLGGLDGIIFAENIKQWLSILSRTRFSQLLDMYYSERGIAYDKNFKACQRQHELIQFLNRNVLQETVNVAKLLQNLGAANQYLEAADLEKYAKLVVEEFEKEAEIQTRKYTCEQEIASMQPLEIICVLDESYIGYKAESFIGELLEAVDLGFYSSTLGIIHGHTGEWLTNVTCSVVQLYEELSVVKSWQTSLKLYKALGAISTYLQTSTRNNCEVTLKAPRMTVILVMAHSSRLSGEDLRASETAINSIKNSHPDTRILYVTSLENSQTYEALSQLRMGDVIKSESAESLMAQIAMKLSNVPTSIVNFYCETSQVHLEDYVTPRITKLYEIHADFLQRAYFSVKFKGNDYGEASICAFASNSPENKKCQAISGNQEIQFDANQYCLSSYNCSTQFSATVTYVRFKCAEFDCRYPDQMRLDILTSWTRKSGSSAICYNIYMVIVVMAKSIWLLNF